ncbi:MAG: hypothetical protein N3F63_01900, partial [Thermoplasmata archaeon]|nr:hypothetical protein [Thermoplasmata archaeon]
MEKEKKEIVFIYRQWQRFQQTVVEFLLEKYQLKTLRFFGVGSIWKVFKTIKRTNISIAYFAGKHALTTVLISKMKGHKVVVIAAGYDVARTHHKSNFL